MHPVTHAESSARRYGGVMEDYLPIHNLMDSSKAAFPDNRHRALTHNNWFFFIVERIFGEEIELTCTGGQGKTECPVLMGTDFECFACGGRGVSGGAKVRYICEQHVLEDFGNKYIPTVADYLEGMEFQEWMNNGVSGHPTSHRKLARQTTTTRRRAITLD